MTGDNNYLPLQEYIPKDVAIAEEVKAIRVSPILGFFLNSTWGWSRLERITHAQNAYYQADISLQQTLHKLATLPDRLDEEHRREMDNLRYEREAIEYARQRLAKEHERENARLDADIRSYNNSSKARNKHPNDAISDPAVRDIRKEVKQFIERKAYIDPVIKEAHEDIDKLVKTKVMSEEEGDRMKAEMADFIRQKILNP